MSTQTEAAADWRGKFSRNLHPDGREQSEEEMLDDEEQHSDHGLQQTGDQKKKNLQAERRNCFRVFKFSLGVFYFLVLAGLMTHLLLVSLENNRLKTSNNQLQTEFSEFMSSFSANNSRFQDELKQLRDENEEFMSSFSANNSRFRDELKQLKDENEEFMSSFSANNSRFQDELKQLKDENEELISTFKVNNGRLLDEMKQLKDENEGINKTLWDEIKQLKNQIEEKRCPEGWMRFGGSCYYKSTEKKTWIDSRSFCQFVGSDLVVVNSKEEQEFVSTMEPKAESWIGLFAEYSSQRQKSEWFWVDGSPLTETFWDEMFSKDPYYYYYAVFLSTDGKWTETAKTYNKNWICEK